MQKNITWNELLPGDYICYQHNPEKHPRMAYVDPADNGARMEMFTHWIDNRKLVAGVLNSFDTKKCWLLKTSFESILWYDNGEFGEEDNIEFYINGVQIIRDGVTFSAILSDEERWNIDNKRKKARDFWRVIRAREEQNRDLLLVLNISDRIRHLTTDDGITDESLLQEYDLMKRAVLSNTIQFTKLYGSRLKALLDIPEYFSIPGLHGETEIEKLGKR
jgi:hypothetical protein